MIDLTEKAASQILKLQNEKNIQDPQRLRIFVEAGGCSGLEYGMSFDEPKSDDVVLQSQGIEFLMDPSSLEFLKGSVVDFDDGLTGKGFDIRNPNAANTCGCGKSFN
jgi:iron-sulfur cluster assembly accessory protein